MQLVYGHRIAPSDDRLVYLADKAGEMVMLLLLPGIDIIKVFPFRKLHLSSSKLLKDLLRYIVHSSLLTRMGARCLLRSKGPYIP